LFNLSLVLVSLTSKRDPQKRPTKETYNRDPQKMGGGDRACSICQYTRPNDVHVHEPKETHKRDDLQSKETHKREPQKRPQKRLTKETPKRDLEFAEEIVLVHFSSILAQMMYTYMNQKRPTNETTFNQKRPTNETHKQRPPKETHKGNPQKRPTKETHKRDLEFAEEILLAQFASILARLMFRLCQNHIRLFLLLKET